MATAPFKARNGLQVLSGNTVLLQVSATLLNLTGNLTITGASFAIGANVSIDSAKAVFGNSTVNTSVSAASFSLANSTASVSVVPGRVDLATVNASVSILVGNSVTVNTTAAFLGNSTANVNITSTSYNLANSTANTVINPGAIRTATINATANIVTTLLTIGSSTVNSTGFYVNGISIGFTTPGSNSQVMFNDSGKANAVAGMVFNKTSNDLTILGSYTGVNLTASGNVAVTGNVSAAAMTAGNFYVTSDKAAKNLKAKHVTDGLIHFQPWHFTFKNDANETPQLGYLAQDIIKKIPDAVTKHGKILSVNYMAVHTAQIHALNNVVDDLQKRIIKLEKNHADNGTTRTAAKRKRTV